MHPKDLAVVWDRWASGATLFDLATEYDIPASQLHRELQSYLASLESVKKLRVGAA